MSFHRGAHAADSQNIRHVRQVRAAPPATGARAPSPSPQMRKSSNRGASPPLVVSCLRRRQAERSPRPLPTLSGEGDPGKLLYANETAVGAQPLRLHFTQHHRKFRVRIQAPNRLEQLLVRTASWAPRLPHAGPIQRFRRLGTLNPNCFQIVRKATLSRVQKCRLRCLRSHSARARAANLRIARVPLLLRHRTPIYSPTGQASQCPLRKTALALDHHRRIVRRKARVWGTHYHGAPSSRSAARATADAHVCPWRKLHNAAYAADALYRSSSEGGRWSNAQHQPETAHPSLDPCRPDRAARSLAAAVLAS